MASPLMTSTKMLSAWSKVTFAGVHVIFALLLQLDPVPHMISAMLKEFSGLKLPLHFIKIVNI